MEQLAYCTVLISRVLIAAVFLLNGFGIIDQGSQPGKWRRKEYLRVSCLC
jgi:hypothetical protein